MLRHIYSFFDSGGTWNSIDNYYSRHTAQDVHKAVCLSVFISGPVTFNQGQLRGHISIHHQ